MAPMPAAGSKAAPDVKQSLRRLLAAWERGAALVVARSPDAAQREAKRNGAPLIRGPH
jgi:hypothetical protein